MEEGVIAGSRFSVCEKNTIKRRNINTISLKTKPVVARLQVNGLKVQPNGDIQHAFKGMAIKVTVHG